MKTCNEIYTQMHDFFQESTGFSMEDSSDLAVRLYAAAVQLESLYAYCDWAVKQSFPQTAGNGYLDYHGQLRGLSRKAGSFGCGTVRFMGESGRSQALTIPIGTVCTTSGLVRFVTTQEGILDTDDTYCDVAIQAETAGASGNVAGGTITYLPQPPVGILGCSNLTATSGGGEAEDDDEFRQRILDSFARLPNGANKAFYQERALENPGVGGVAVIPCANGVGTVSVVVAGASGLPSDDLIEEVQGDLDNVREIAVTVEVLAPTAVSCDVSLSISPIGTTTFDEAKAAVVAVIGAYFDGSRLGRPVYLAELGNLIFQTGLLANYHFTSPSDDVAVDVDELPVLGTLVVTEATT